MAGVPTQRQNAIPALKLHPPLSSTMFSIRPSTGFGCSRRPRRRPWRDADVIPRRTLIDPKGAASARRLATSGLQCVALGAGGAGDLELLVAEPVRANCDDDERPVGGDIQFLERTRESEAK